MKAVVLVGGLGTRLRPVTFSIPKPLLPIGESPILEIIIGQLKRAGCRELVLATGYHAGLIQAFCGDGSRFGLRITYVHEEKPLGTAGPLALARETLGDEESFLVMNGDVITDLDFRDFANASEKSGCDLTVAYADYVYRSPYGVLSLAEGAVVDVQEKPEQSFAVSAGIYFLRSAAVEFVPQNQFFTMPDLMKRLIAVGRRIHAYRIAGVWLGLENVEHLDEALTALRRIRQNSEQ